MNDTMTIEEAFETVMEVLGEDWPKDHPAYLGATEALAFIRQEYESYRDATGDESLRRIEAEEELQQVRGLYDHACERLKIVDAELQQVKENNREGWWSALEQTEAANAALLTELQQVKAARDAWQQDALKYLQWIEQVKADRKAMSDAIVDVWADASDENLEKLYQANDAWQNMTPQEDKV